MQGVIVWVSSLIWLNWLLLLTGAVKTHLPAKVQLTVKAFKEAIILVLKNQTIYSDNIGDQA